MPAVDIVRTLENIVTLFKENGGEMTTRELFSQMVDQFHFKHTQRNLEHYLDNLEAKCLDGVILKKARNRRDKKRSAHSHLLIDKRITATEELKKEHAKQLSKEKLIAEEKAYMRLALQAIKELPKLSDKHYETIAERFHLNEFECPYFIESEETELLEPSNYSTSELIKAIEKDATVEFKFTAKSSRDIYVVEPYKLITFDGLWYLFGKDTDDTETPFKTWRLMHIEITGVDSTSTHDIDDDTIEDVLEQAHSADFVVEDIETATVKSLRVEVLVSSLIEDKIQLPGEIEERNNEDGTRTITCDVSSIKEIDRDIKAWLPHVSVISPTWYKERFEEELEIYVENLKR